MNKITIRERAKINAALTSIHAQGHDASAVTAAAKSLIARGTRPLPAYSQALTTALANDPNAAREIGRIVAQIDASDDGTVAQYDRALSSYIQTGDPASIAAIAPIVVRDAVTLAVRNGEMTQEDVDAGRIAWEAIGMNAESAESAYASEPAAPPPVKSEFAFQQGPAPTPDQPGVLRTVTGGVRAAPTGIQAKREAGVPTDGPMIRTTTGGYRAPMTGQRLARHLGTPLPQGVQSEEQL